MNTPLNDALKPCPMCGGLPTMNELILGKYWHLACGNVLHSACANSWESADAAIAAWNTRANTPESSAAQGAMTPKRAEFLKWLKDTHNIVPEQAMTESNAYRIAADYLEKVAGEEGFYGNHVMTLAEGIKSLRNAAQPSDATAQPSDTDIANAINAIRRMSTAQGISAQELPRAIALVRGLFPAQPRVDLTDEQIAKHLAEHGIGYIRLAKDATGYAEAFTGYDAEIYGNAIRSLLANTAQGKTEQDAIDANRWRELLKHVGGTFTDTGAQRFTLRYLSPMEGANIMRGSVAGHLTTTIDALAAKKG